MGSTAPAGTSIGREPTRAPSTRAIALVGPAGTGKTSLAEALLFASGARRMTLASLGLIQYLAPTIQLLLGVWVFGEAFDAQRLVGFVFIWSALALVSAHALGLRLPRPA